MASAHELRPLLSSEHDFRGIVGGSSGLSQQNCGSSYGSVVNNGTDAACFNGNNGTGKNNNARAASLPLPLNLPDTLSLASLYICIIVSDACRGLLFPTLWFNVTRLGGSASALGSIVALINVGKMIGAPVQGFLTDYYGTKTVLILSNIVISLGAAIYAFASTYSSSYNNCGGGDDKSFAIHMIMASHGVLGIGAGNLGIIRSCIMDYSSDEEASTNMAYLSILQYGAYIALPVFGSLLTIWAPSMDNSEILASHAKLLSSPNGNNNNNNNCNLEAQQGGGNFYVINKYNIAGLVLFLLATFNVLFTHKYLKIHDRSKTSTTVATTHALSKNAASLSGDTADSSFISNQSPWSTAITLCCALNFIIKGSVGVFETFALSFAVSQFEWAAKTSGIVLAICGALGILILSQFAVLAKLYNDSTIIFAGMILMAVSFLFLIVDALYATSLSSGDSSEESKFSLQIRSIFLYASFMAMLGCGYPLAHTSLLGALSSNIKKANFSISSCTCQAETASVAAFNISDGTSISSAVKVPSNSTGTSGSAGLNSIGNGIGSGAALNSWFAFFGFMGKLVLPLLAGFLLNSRSYGIVFSMIFCLLLASIIIAIKCRQSLL